MQTDEPVKLVSRSVAAQMLGVQESQIRRYEAQGDLPVADRIPAGSLPRVMYTEADVLKVKEARERKQAQRKLLKGSKSGTIGGAAQ